MNGETRKLASRRRSAIGSDNTFLGISIGDRSVSMTLAHVDRPDHLLRIREHTVPFSVARGHTLSMGQIAGGLRQCWERFEGLEARRTALLFPSWCSTAEPVTGRMPIPAWWGDPEGTPAEVTKSDVLRLAGKVCREGVPPGRVVAGLACERYVHGGLYTVDDPVGAITTDLEVHGHRFLADAGFVKGVLDLLDGMDIEVDVLATPLSALPALLLEAEGKRDCILVEIGQRHATCGLFRLGRPIRMAEAPWGADDVLTGVAGRLRVDEESVMRCLASKRDRLMAPGVCGAQVLHFGDGRTMLSATVAEIDAALAASARPLVARLQAFLEDALRGCDEVPATVVVIGDCPVILRAVADAGTAVTPHQPWVSREVPEVHRDHVDPAIMDRTRMAGALRLVALMPPLVQPCLEARHGGPPRPPFEDAVSQARNAARRAAGIWRSVRPRLRPVRDRVMRAVAWIAAVLRAARSSTAAPRPAAPGQDRSGVDLAGPMV